MGREGGMGRARHGELIGGVGGKGGIADMVQKECQGFSVGEEEKPLLSDHPHLFNQILLYTLSVT